MKELKVERVERKRDDNGTYARTPSNNWKVFFSDGEEVGVANYGEGAEAMGMCFHKGEKQENHGRMAERAVDEFMGWD